MQQPNAELTDREFKMMFNASGWGTNAPTQTQPVRTVYYGTCQCGTTLRMTNAKRHLRTQKHRAYILINPDIEATYNRLKLESLRLTAALHRLHPQPFTLNMYEAEELINRFETEQARELEQERQQREQEEQDNEEGRFIQQIPDMEAVHLREAQEQEQEREQREQEERENDFGALV